MNRTKIMCALISIKIILKGPGQKMSAKERQEQIDSAMREVEFLIKYVEENP